MDTREQAKEPTAREAQRALEERQKRFAMEEEKGDEAT